MGMVGPHCAPLPQEKPHQEIPMEQDRVGFSQAAAAETPRGRGWGGWLITPAPPLHCPCGVGSPQPPSCHLSPHRALSCSLLLQSPQSVTLSPTKPITLTVHFPPNAPRCSAQCLILHPSVQHPKSATAAPPHPRGHPISSVPAAVPQTP